MLASIEPACLTWPLFYHIQPAVFIEQVTTRYSRLKLTKHLGDSPGARLGPLG